MVDAKARALLLAKDAGVTLDAPMSTSENISGPIPYAKNFAAGVASSAAVSVQAGRVQVELQVSMVYLSH